MNSRIMTIYLLTYLCLGCTGWSEQSLPLHHIRAAGDALDISIQQELDRASALGVQWIRERQNPDGSWGLSNAVETTALCVVALASRNDPALSAHIRSALQSLRTRTLQNTETNFSAIAWTALAMLVAEPPGCTAESCLRRLRNPETTLTTAEAALRDEIILGSATPEGGELSRQPSRTRYAAAALMLNCDAARMLPMWLDARVINREGQGQLVTAQGERVDWRRIFARKIISTQKIDPQGGGFWQGPTPSQTVINTALALLISKEL